MINAEQVKLLRDLPQTSYGHALKAYLNDELAKLNDVSTIKTHDETLGRQHGIKIIKQLFSFMDNEKLGSKQKTVV